MKIRYLIILLIVLTTSCKTLNETVYNRNKALKNIPDVKLLNHVEDNNLDFDDIYLRKVEISASINKKKYNVKSNFWIQKDSIINISVIPLMGIEMFRIQFNTDSVIIIDRTKRKITSKDYSFISNIVNVEVNYFVIQSILTNSMFCLNGLDNGNDCLKKFKNYTKDGFYAFQSIKERRYNKLEKKLKDDIIYQEFLIDSEKFRVNKAVVNSIYENKKLEINYTNFENIDSVLFPKLISLFGKDQLNTINIDLIINNISIDGETKLNFKVPNKYDKE